MPGGPCAADTEKAMVERRIANVQEFIEWLKTSAAKSKDGVGDLARRERGAGVVEMGDPGNPWGVSAGPLEVERGARTCAGVLVSAMAGP